MTPKKNRDWWRLQQWYPSPVYNWFRGRELEDTVSLGPKVGVFLQTGMRVHKGWGMVPESRCPQPQPNFEWPISVPKTLDEIAKYNCAPIYSRVTDLAQTLTCIANGFPVVASFTMNCNHWQQAPQGFIDVVKVPEDAAHCICIEGYSQASDTLRFANSWGYSWGEQGYGSMTFQYFRERLQEAYILLPGVGSGIKNQPLCGFGTNLPTGMYECLEEWDVTSGIKSGWIIARIDESHIEIEDLYVRPEYRKHKIATRLLQTVIDMSEDLNLSLGAWISIANTDPKNATLTAITKLCARFNFKVRSANVGWARYRAIRNTPGKSAAIVHPTNPTPPSCTNDTFSTIYYGPSE